MDSERVRMKIMGISYSPLQNNAFAMLLGEVNGPYRLPIVIGAPEAQSIAIKLENIITPRPITHDLFTTFSHAFGIKLLEIFIYKFEDDMFSSEMKFSNGEVEVLVDARASDAVAIALRMNAPIYTTREILEKAGMIFEDEDVENIQEPVDEDVEADALADMDTEALVQRLQKCIEDEEYEEAARIKEILKAKQDPQE